MVAESVAKRVPRSRKDTVDGPNSMVAYISTQLPRPRASSMTTTTYRWPKTFDPPVCTKEASVSAATDRLAAMTRATSDLPLPVAARTRTTSVPASKAS
jgi:hypothetical protein